MLDIYLHPSHTHVLWVDADLVEYPADLATRLHALHSNGIVAPFPMIENTARFYDVRGFLDTTGRYAHPWHPYLAGGDLIPMQAVGCCYLAPAQIYLAGVRYRTTQGETEHYSVCRWAREAGYAVLAVRTLVVQHANLPEYGERWH